MVDIKITNGMMIEQLASTALVSIFRVLYVISGFISTNICLDISLENNDLSGQHCIQGLNHPNLRQLN